MKFTLQHLHHIHRYDTLEAGEENSVAKRTKAANETSRQTYANFSFRAFVFSRLQSSELGMGDAHKAFVCNACMFFLGASKWSLSFFTIVPSIVLFSLF